MKKNTNDLTIGNPSSVLWKFCLPLFGSVIFQQFYNVADSLIAGKFIGENALAAVGNSYEVTLIFIAFATGCNMACSVITSQLFGAKKYDTMKTAIYTAMISVAVLCMALMLFGILCADGLLHLMNTPEVIYADSKLYMDIYVWGLPFLFFYNLSTGIFSAMGDSKTPFLFLAVSSTANIAVNLLFVCVFQMGVAGLAWATFCCQGISCILAVITIFRRLKQIETDEASIRYFDKELLKKFTALAVPSILQQSSISIGTIIIQSSINACGVGVTAGYAAAIKLGNLVISAFTTIGNGMSNYTAQNIGANKMDRVRQGYKAGVQMVWTICVPIVLIYTFGAKTLISFFMENPTELALKSGMHFLYISAPFYFLISVKLMTDGIFRGGDHMKEFVFSTTLDLVVRVILVKILVKPLGYLGIWISWPIGWILGFCMSRILYVKIFKEPKA